MKYFFRFSLGLGAIVLGVFVIPKVSFALTVGEILNQPKVLDANTSNPFPYPTASLVKDGSTIYFISGTTKVPFTNYKAFTGLGYTLKNVVSGDLSNYSASQTYFISTYKTTHAWGSWVSYKGAVYYSAQDGFIGVPSSEIFLSNGGEWNLVVKANSYDITAIKNSNSLATLTDNDSRVMGQPVLQFSGPTPSTNPVSPTPAPSSVPTPTQVNPITASSTYISPSPQVTVPTNVYASTTATFSVAFQDPNPPVVYTFDWDDGSVLDSVTSNFIVHTYYLTGTYMINVSTLDHAQNVTSTTVPVTVVVPPMTSPSLPQFALPSGTVVGQEITITANSSDPQSLPLFYTFSWGDGTPDTAGNPNVASHTYTSSNSYIVKVTASDNQGFSNFNQDSIYIAP